jgi:predicted GNAT family N-acyltransferase
MMASELSDLHIKTCLLADEYPTLHRIREVVFQAEQGIDPTLDWDGHDHAAIHLLAYLGEIAVGAARLREVDAGITLKLERLAVLPSYRYQGIGGEMVHTAIAYGKVQGYQQMVIHAQEQTATFYQGLGFKVVGEPFMEAGIAHLKMERPIA